MRTLSSLAIIVVALLHCGFAYLEMVAWTQEFGLRTFNMTQEEAALTAPLALNQGFYNLMLAIALLSALFYRTRNTIRVLLVIIIAVGIFGGLTISPKIWVLQAAPAIIAWLLTRVTVMQEKN